MKESNVIMFGNDKEKINKKILNTYFPNISKDNPVMGKDIMVFLKLNYPKAFVAYTHKNYNVFLREEFSSVNDLSAIIIDASENWEMRKNDKKEFSARIFGELKLEGIDDYLKEQKINLSSEKIRGILKGMIGDELLSELNIGRVRFSNKYILCDMDPFSEPLTEKEFLADPQNIKKRATARTYPKILKKIQYKDKDALIIQANCNDIEFFNMKYLECPSYLETDKNWHEKYFTSAVLHEFLHCAFNDKLTLEEIVKYKELIKTERYVPATQYASDFMDGKREGGFIEDQLTELGKLYVLDYDSISRKLPKQVEWFSKKFPTIKRDYIKKYFLKKNNLR